MNQCFKSEEAELNVHPTGLILLEIHVNISFCNNVKSITHKSVKLNTHKNVLWKCSFSSQTKVKNVSVTSNTNGNVKFNTCLTYAVSFTGRET